jgi:L-fucose mutarotase
MKNGNMEANMLKGISPVISPDLIKTLMEMGHGDEIVIADGNFPAASVAQRLVRADGLGVPVLLDAVLRIFPLDRYVEKPVALMAVVPGDTYQPVIWEEYKTIIEKYESKFKDFEYVERFAFYERAKKAYAVLATSEMALYANIILKKGVINS